MSEHQKRVLQIELGEAYVFIHNYNHFHAIVDGCYLYSTDYLARGLMGTYFAMTTYILNIKYPKSFLQHFDLGVKYATKLPTCILTVHSKLVLTLLIFMILSNNLHQF